MAVDRQGDAYVLWVNSTAQQTPGRLYLTNTSTAKCTALDYPLAASGFAAFGMGFVRSPAGNTDMLYATFDNSTSQEAGILATIGIPGLQIHAIGQFSPELVQNAELAGTGDGRLFAFYPTEQGMSSAVAEIDSTNARVIGKDGLKDLPLAGSFGPRGWAFVSWGGEFYLFTTNLSAIGSVVTRFNPSDRSQVSVGSLPELIVGAGVSTCAP
jgi:hypothetical protein